MKPRTVSPPSDRPGDVGLKLALFSCKYKIRSDLSKSNVHYTVTRLTVAWRYIATDGTSCSDMTVVGSDTTVHRHDGTQQLMAHHAVFEQMTLWTCLQSVFEQMTLWASLQTVFEQMTLWTSLQTVFEQMIFWERVWKRKKNESSGVFRVEERE